MEWQPIETAPKTGETILGFDPSWYDIATPIFFNGDKERWQFFQISEEVRPTHWMPMLKAPNYRLTVDLQMDSPETLIAFAKVLYSTMPITAETTVKISSADGARVILGETSIRAADSFKPNALVQNDA